MENNRGKYRIIHSVKSSQIQVRIYKIFPPTPPHPTANYLLFVPGKSLYRVTRVRCHPYLSQLFWVQGGYPRLKKGADLMVIFPLFYTVSISPKKAIQVHQVKSRHKYITKIHNILFPPTPPHPTTDR